MATNKKTQAKAPVAEANQTDADTLPGVIAETVVLEDGSIIEAGTEILVEAAVAPHNASMIVWPTDVWGFTAPLKDALVAAASRVNGAEDKKALVDAVLATGMAHLNAKYTVDAGIRQAAIDAAIAENEAKEEELEAPAQLELF